MDSWAPGDRVAGRFTVKGPPLGQGATGVVYPGVDLDGSRVALKQLRPGLVDAPDRLARLQRELARADRLAHPNVLRVRGVFPHGATTVLVTDRASEGSLAEVVGALEPAAAVVVALHVARALAAAHAEGLVHGDVRPGNVLLDRDGARLFDFGLAGAARIGELRPGETPPEVLDGAPPGERADLYGVGLVLYRAATGHAAFEGPTAWSRIGRQREGALDLDGLPAGLSACLALLLHPDPLRRPPTAVAVLRLLKRVQRRPDRRVRAPHRPLAPLRLRGRWGVHGVDPATGSRAMLRTGLGGAEARRLARRLEGEGWAVRADPLALGPGDLLWALLPTVLLGALLPVVGLLPGFYLGLRWRSARVRHELPQALPTVLAPLPPRRLPAGGEVAVVSGLLLLLAAAVALVSVHAALLPLAVAAGLVAQHARRRRLPTEAVLREGRVEGALLLARRDLDRRAPDLPLDELLGRMGALDALEAAWRAGEVGADEVLRATAPDAGEASVPAHPLVTR